MQRARRSTAEIQAILLLAPDIEEQVMKLLLVLCRAPSGIARFTQKDKLLLAL